MMDYISKIKEAGFGESTAYPQNDIGIARLFYDLHSDVLRYVIESKTWFAYDGGRWTQTKGIEIVWKFQECYTELEQGFMPELNI